MRLSLSWNQHFLKYENLNVQHHVAEMEKPNALATVTIPSMAAEADGGHYYWCS